MLTSADLAFPNSVKPAVRDVISKRAFLVKPLEVFSISFNILGLKMVRFEGLGCKYGESSFFLSSKERG